MGACILCGKSAGLFYSLHKNCFEKYDQSDGEIDKLLLRELGNTDPDVLTETIDQLLEGYGFKKEARQRTLVRALELFAKKHNDKNPAYDYSAWVKFLKAQSFDESLLLNKHFVAQQENLSALWMLQENKLPEVNCNAANFSIELQTNEQLWWCFNSGSILELSPVKTQQQWSIVKQIIEGLFTRKQKARLEQAPVDEGKVLLSNQRLYFDGNNSVETIEYANIYSCTPVSDGVRIQTSMPEALPRTYLCEDGRLLYKFLDYARKTAS